MSNGCNDSPSSPMQQSHFHQQNELHQSPPDAHGFDDYDEEDFHPNHSFMRNHPNVGGSTSSSFRR